MFTKFQCRKFLPVLCLGFVSACFGRINAKYDKEAKVSPYDDEDGVYDESTLQSEKPFNHDDQGGGAEIILQIPLPKGVMLLCTQGVKGKYSHSQKSTIMDLDFDTSNTEREEVYASVSGIAHVHTSAATKSGFGNHINIDIGGGYYVVIAHLDEILVCDGCEVSVGQLIGLEGCTGLCTGDHVHVGLHKGDASLPAEKGESVSATYVISDNDGQERTLSSEQFVCGTGNGKDGEPVGKSYTSALPVALAHPDGTIVKTQHDAKVYLIENGELRWFANEEVFWSRGYDFSNLVVISDEELDCYQMGVPFMEKGLVDAFRDPIGYTWLVVGSDLEWNKYRIWVSEAGWEGVLKSWGLNYTKQNPPPKRSWTDKYLSDWYEKPGKAQFRNGTLIKEYSKSDVYVAEQNAAMPIKDWETFLLEGFGERPIIEVGNGVIKSVQPFIGNCVGGTYCISTEIVTTCGHPMLVAQKEPYTDQDENQNDNVQFTDAGFNDNGTEYGDDDSQDDQYPQDQNTGQQPSEESSQPDNSTPTSATFTVSYPYSAPRTLNVQMYDNRSDLGGWWDTSVSDTDSDVALILYNVPDDICGFRLNVAEGNPATSWLCVGNGTAASLDPNANISISYNGVTYSKSSLMIWSAPGGPSAGCSALLEVNSTGDCAP